MAKNHNRADAAVGLMLVSGVVGAFILTHTPPETPEQLAQNVSTELYSDKTDKSKGVHVPGVLNGSVDIELVGAVGHPMGHYNNAVILKSKRPLKNVKSAADLDGAVIGVPGNNTEGHVVLTPMTINLGTNKDDVETITFKDQSDLIFENAAIYPTAVTDSPDLLMAFDPSGNNNFPSVPVTSTGMK